jgi:pyruvate,water dikinase
MGLLSRALTSLRNLRLRSHGRPLDPGEEEEVFQERYHNLRLLLAANKKALDLMAEMERAAQGEAVFGMTFVRSRCTSVGVSVFRMIRCLDALAPDRYRGLARRFEGIEEAIREILEAVPSDREAVPLVLPLGEVDSSMVDAVGAKMANLGEVLNVVGLPCPDGFVLTSPAYRRFLEGNDLQSEVDRLIQSSSADRVDEIYALSSQIQQRILEAEIPVELEAAADRAFSDLCERVGFVPTVALRSSALGEDTETASFAGQYRSQLNVRREHLLDAYKDVVASKYTPQAMHYRLERGLRDELMAMCVGCLVMVPARIGGVAYTGGNPFASCDTALPLPRSSSCAIQVKG